MGEGMPDGPDGGGLRWRESHTIRRYFLGRYIGRAPETVGVAQVANILEVKITATANTMICKNCGKLSMSWEEDSGLHRAESRDGSRWRFLGKISATRKLNFGIFIKMLENGVEDCDLIVRGREPSVSNRTR